MSGITHNIMNVICFEFAVTASCFVDGALSEIVVGVFIDVMDGEIIGFVEVLAEVYSKISRTALVFSVLKPPGELGCGTAFCCWPLTAFNCARISQ